MRANPSLRQRAALYLLFTTAFLCVSDIASLGRAQEVISDQDKRIRLLTEHIVFVGPMPVPVEYGPQLIPDLIRLLNAHEKVPDLEKIMDLRDHRFALLRGLVRAIQTFEGSDEAKLGRAAVYDLMNNAELSIRHQAMGELVRLDGEGATDVWLEKLWDPDDTIRVIAAQLLGAQGRVNAAAQIEKILQERTRRWSAEQLAKDPSLKWMRAAIAQLQDRAQGKSGPSASERVNAADLIERGPGSTKPPNSTPAATPSAMTPTKSEPPTSQSPPVASAAQSPGLSISLFWTAAAAAALLAILLFFWKRRT